jgi:hypothetical protein
LLPSVAFATSTHVSQLVPALPIIAFTLPCSRSIAHC